MVIGRGDCGRRSLKSRRINKLQTRSMRQYGSFSNLAEVNKQTIVVPKVGRYGSTVVYMGRYRNTERMLTCFTFFYNAGQSECLPLLGSFHRSIGNVARLVTSAASAAIQRTLRSSTLRSS